MSTKDGFLARRLFGVASPATRDEIKLASPQCLLYALDEEVFEPIEGDLFKQSRGLLAIMDDAKNEVLDLQVGDLFSGQCGQGVVSSRKRHNSTTTSVTYVITFGSHFKGWAPETILYRNQLSSSMPL